MLLAAEVTQLTGLTASENVLSDLEQEVVVMVSPVEFVERYVEWQIPIERARRALHDMGYELPVAISSREALSDELMLWHRLRTVEIARFDSLTLN